MPDGPAPAPEPWVLHATLLELLKRLDQAPERAGDAGGEGLEFAEVQRAMAPFWSARAPAVDLQFALQILVENGLARAADGPPYAWDRRRVAGRRFRITPEGRSYLKGPRGAAGRVPRAPRDGPPTFK